MKKQMLQVSVELTEEGTITITQENGHEDADIILVAPEQVETLCRWLMEAAEAAGPQT